MDAIVNLIMGTSTTLDAFVVVRIIAMCMGLELLVVGCSMLGGMKGR